MYTSYKKSQFRLLCTLGQCAFGNSQVSNIWEFLSKRFEIRSVIPIYVSLVHVFAKVLCNILLSCSFCSGPWGSNRCHVEMRWLTKVETENYQIEGSQTYWVIFFFFGLFLPLWPMEDLRAHGDFMKHSEQIRQDHKNVLVFIHIIILFSLWIDSDSCPILQLQQIEIHRRGCRLCSWNLGFIPAICHGRYVSHSLL